MGARSWRVYWGGSAESERASPGRQRLHRRSWIGPGYVGLLVLLSVVLLVHAVVSANELGNGLPFAWFWRLSLIDVNTAFTILVALLSLIAVRQQFIYGTKPFLVYHSQFTHASRLGLPGAGAGERIWQVTLSNAGQGAAAIREVRYRIAARGNTLSDSYPLPAASLTATLEGMGLRYERDYSLVSFSEGFRVIAGAEQPIFEVFEAAAAALQSIDMRIEIEGLLGDRFVKEVFLIPRGGLPEIAAASTQGSAPPAS